MNNEKFILYKYNLKTIVNGDKISTSGYKYLSIYTDGFINPDLAIPDTTSGKTGFFYITTDNNITIPIISELKNFDISKNEYIMYYNYLCYLTSCSFSEAGYGNIYFVLHNEPYDFSFLDKKYPDVSTSFSLAPSSEKNLWIGINQIQKNDTMLLGYIKNLYSYINIFISCDNPSITSGIVYGYPYDNDDNKFNLGYLMIGLSPDLNINTLPIYNLSRFRITISNTDMMSSVNVYMYIVFNKS